MRYIKDILLFAAIAIASAALEPRNGHQLIQDIGGINFAVLALTSTLEQYHGGINQSAPATVDILAIHAINRKGFADANKSATLSAAESQKLVNYTKNSVGVSIPKSINVTKAKKPLFDAAELTSLVEASLKLLLQDHDTFSAAVGEKLDPSSAAEGVEVAGKIALAIQDGIDYYAT